MWNKWMARLLCIAGVAFPFQLAAASNSRPSVSGIEGNVFIVTKAQQSIRLALVTVVAVYEADLVDFIKTKSNAINEQRRLDVLSLKNQISVLNGGATIHEQEQEWSKLRREIFNIFERCKGLYGNHYDKCKDVNSLSSFTAQADALEEKLNLTREKMAQLDALQTKYEQAVMPNAFFNGVESYIKKPLGVAKTDVEGKFSLNVPSGKRVALVARSGRHVAGDSEKYLWVIWITAQKSDRKLNVMLANDNLIETGCIECVNYNHIIENGLELDTR